MACRRDCANPGRVRADPGRVRAPKITGEDPFDVPDVAIDQELHVVDPEFYQGNGANFEINSVNRLCAEKASNVTLRKCAEYHWLAGFGQEVIVRPAAPAERACSVPNDGFVAINGDHIKAGLQFPLPGMLVDLLNNYHIGLCQLAPNAVQIILAFIIRCLQLKLEPRADVFCWFYQVRTSKPYYGYYNVQTREGRPILFSGFPSKNDGWKHRYFFIDARPEFVGCKYPSDWGEGRDSASLCPSLSSVADHVRILEEGSTCHLDATVYTSPELFGYFGLNSRKLMPEQEAEVRAFVNTTLSNCKASGCHTGKGPWVSYAGASMERAPVLRSGRPWFKAAGGDFVPTTPPVNRTSRATVTTLKEGASNHTEAGHFPGSSYRDTRVPLAPPASDDDSDWDDAPLVRKTRGKVYASSKQDSTSNNRSRPPVVTSSTPLTLGVPISTTTSAAAAPDTSAIISDRAMPASPVGVSATGCEVVAFTAPVIPPAREPVPMAEVTNVDDDEYGAPPSCTGDNFFPDPSCKHTTILDSAHSERDEAVDDAPFIAQTMQMSLASIRSSCPPVVTSSTPTTIIPPPNTTCAAVDEGTGATVTDDTMHLYQYASPSSPRMGAMCSQDYARYGISSPPPESLVVGMVENGRAALVRGRESAALSPPSQLSQRRRLNPTVGVKPCTAVIETSVLAGSRQTGSSSGTAPEMVSSATNSSRRQLAEESMQANSLEADNGRIPVGDPESLVGAMAAGGASSLRHSFAPSYAPTRLTRVPFDTVSSSEAAAQYMRSNLQKLIGNCLPAADGRCHLAATHIAEALGSVLTRSKEEDALTSEVRDLRRSNEELMKEDTGLREVIHVINHDLELQQMHFKCLEENTLKVEDENRFLRAQMQELAAKHQADRELLLEENRAARAEMEINHVRALEGLEREAKVIAHLKARLTRTGRKLGRICRDLQSISRLNTRSNRSRPHESHSHGRC